MNNKIRNIVVTSVFVLFIAFFVIMCIVRIINPVTFSQSERKELELFPQKITWEGVLDKSVIDDFEDASVDQFPFRDFFRGLKAKFQYGILGLKENNGHAVEDGYIAAITPQFTDKAVNYSIGRLQAYYDKFVKGNGGNHYFSLVPDKNYYFAENYGYPAPDYAGLKDKVTGALPEMEYIDIFGELELEDYYRTDTHWRQEKIEAVVNKLASEMGISDRLSGEYKENVFEGFKGVYHGHSALNPEPDELVYLTNDILDNCTVTYMADTVTQGDMYVLDRLSGRDAYEMFLNGVIGGVRIDNPASNSGKSLVIFRDSFGSSVAPLFVEAYDTVYLIDIRSATTKNLEGWIDRRLVNFENADVLFLYSALILNSISFSGV